MHRSIQNHKVKDTELQDDQKVSVHLMIIKQGGLNMTGTCAACLHTDQSRSYLNHLVL
jgi:hypothetical protein